MRELSEEHPTDTTRPTGPRAASGGEAPDGERDGASAAARDETPAGKTGEAPAGATSDREYWEERYGADERVWSGRPNALLTTETSDLTPGRALDVGCGEGGDAIWLAEQGWRVTATDLSANALRHVAEQAARRGVADRVECARHELGHSFPEGRFDLVSSFFLHSWQMPDRGAILRRAADAVVPGGTLLIVGHVRMPEAEHGDHPPQVDLPTAAEVLAELRLAEGEWEVGRCADYLTTHHDGQPRTDSVVRARRLPN